MIRAGLTFVFLLLAGPAWAGEAPLMVAEARQQVELTGYSRSRIDMTLSAEVSGKVLDVGYDVGDAIGKAPFVRIDPTFIDFSIALTRQGIAQLDAALAQNQSRTDYLQKEYARIDALFQKNSTPAQRRDQFRQDLDQALLQRPSLLAQKAAEQTRLSELLERKKRHDVYAPPGWIVTARHVDPGEIVSAGTPLASVGDYRRLVVPLSVTSEELAAIESFTAPFAVRLDGRPAEASVRWVNPEFDEDTRKLAVELAVDRWDGERRGGLVMTLTVEIPAPGLSVPKAAVVNRFENPRVRLKESGKEIQVIVLGETNSSLRIAENPKLRPGMALAPAGKEGRSD